jgi:HK97 family phage major capsid protein
LANPLDLGIARNAHRAVKEADRALNLMVRSEQQELSLSSGIADLRSGHGLQGFNREALQEFAHMRGGDFDPIHPTWPYSILATRATPLTVLGAANGGDLVASENQALTDILRPYSPLLKSGVTVITGLQSNAKFPIVIGDVSGQWLSSETVNITDVSPLLGIVASSPKTLGVDVRWSPQVQRQVRDIEDDVRRICGKAAIEGVDAAAINGSGATGVPLGLLNQPGIGTQSGAGYSHSNSLTTREALASLNVDDEAVAWLGSPNTRTVLAERERAPGNKFVWDEDQITDRDARVSSIVPPGTLIAGDWSQLVYAFYGSGFQIDVTPYASSADFQAGIMALRLMVSVDVVLLHPTAFVAITTVT